MNFKNLRNVLVFIKYLAVFSILIYCIVTLQKLLSEEASRFRIKLNHWLEGDLLDFPAITMCSRQNNVPDLALKHVINRIGTERLRQEMPQIMHLLTILTRADLTELNTDLFKSRIDSLDGNLMVEEQDANNQLDDWIFRVDKFYRDDCLNQGDFCYFHGRIMDTIAYIRNYRDYKIWRERCATTYDYIPETFSMLVNKYFMLDFVPFTEEAMKERVEKFVKHLKNNFHSYLPTCEGQFDGFQAITTTATTEELPWNLTTTTTVTTTTTQTTTISTFTPAPTLCTRDGRKCKIPFYYQGVEYRKCVKDFSADSWCYVVEYDIDYSLITKYNWDYCASDCVGFEKGRSRRSLMSEISSYDELFQTAISVVSILDGLDSVQGGNCQHDTTMEEFFKNIRPARSVLDLVKLMHNISVVMTTLKSDAGPCHYRVALRLDRDLKTKIQQLVDSLEVLKFEDGLEDPTHVDRSVTLAQICDPNLDLTILGLKCSCRCEKILKLLIFNIHKHMELTDRSYLADMFALIKNRFQDNFYSSSRIVKANSLELAVLSAKPFSHFDSMDGLVGNSLDEFILKFSDDKFAHPGVVQFQMRAVKDYMDTIKLAKWGRYFWEICLSQNFANLQYCSNNTEPDSGYDFFFTTLRSLGKAEELATYPLDGSAYFKNKLLAKASIPTDMGIKCQTINNMRLKTILQPGDWVAKFFGSEDLDEAERLPQTQVESDDEVLIMLLEAPRSIAQQSDDSIWIAIDEPGNMPFLSFRNDWHQIFFSDCPTCVKVVDVTITASEADISESMSDTCVPEGHELQHFRHYTVKNCVMDCLWRSAYHTCGCKPWKVPTLQLESICSLKGTICFETWIEHQLANGSLITGCNCRQPCHQVQYDSTLKVLSTAPPYQLLKDSENSDLFGMKETLTSLLKKETSQVKALLSPVLDESISSDPMASDKNLALVRFRLTKKEVGSVNEVKDKSMDDLTSWFGGFQGPLCGMSILGLVRLLLSFLDWSLVTWLLKKPKEEEHDCELCEPASVSQVRDILDDLEKEKERFLLLLEEQKEEEADDDFFDEYMYSQKDAAPYDLSDVDEEKKN